ncbi:MAG: cysteine--tRNA ligase [Bacteroidales bacterium]|nr:cysteine--tRNA ligase [Bacteroidales bacterium]
MQQRLSVYNTLTRSKEPFQPLHPPFVGMYVCGPTVYGHAHLGHARSAITFDLIFRYLKNIGFKVRYVRNITDVGHLENDADEGEDKIAKKARLDKLEPMEVVQAYTESYHRDMDQLNVLRPSIEPRASGHIIEQIEMVKKILASGFGYEVNGSVYFDVEKYSKAHQYGKLSGRVLDDLLASTRELDGQEEKQKPYDFALWKKADAEHIMRWPSPWGYGFPGWHMECSAMGTKYLGDTFDIHGGGMDLLFPHHEAEIAQSTAALGHESVRYWLHNNMITISGQKMGKSLNNFIIMSEFFSGSHPLLEKAYSPMAIRFFILQAHYRSTLDFSNEALQAAEKGFKRLMTAKSTLEKLKPGEKSDSNIKVLNQACYDAMNDDFNSPVVIAQLFEGVRIINSINDGNESITSEDLELLKTTFSVFMTEILGLLPEEAGQSDLVENLMQTIISIRKQAREAKDFKTSDLIRDELKSAGIALKDSKDGTNWERL